MKFPLQIITCIVIYICQVIPVLHAQFPIYSDFRLPGDQIAFAAAEISVSRIVIIGTSGNLYTKEYNGWLYILNPDGSKLTEFTYQLPGKSVQFKYLISGQIQEIKIAAEILDLNTYKSQIALITIGLGQPENPVILQQLFYGDSLQNLELNGMKPDVNGTPVLYGYDRSSTDGFILRNSQFTWFGGNGKQSIQGLGLNPHGGWLACITEFEPGAFISAVYLNSQFQLNYSHKFPSEIYEVKSPEWNTDSTWFCTGARDYCLQAPNALRPADIISVKGNIDSGIVQVQCMGTVNQNDKPGGLSLHSDSAKYIASWTPSYRIFVPQSQGYARNKIPLIRIDTSGHILSETELGETAYYEIHQVSRSSEGSNLRVHFICGSRYDIYNTESGTDAFLVVIPEGYILSQEKTNIPQKYYVYPNPAQNKLYFNLPESSHEFEFTLMNISGEIILQKKIFRETCTDLPESISQGIYFVVIKSEENIFRQKIYIQQ